jgi:hypothetical protein
MSSNQTLDRVLHGVAGIGPLLFFAIASIEGHFRPGYDPIAEPISSLALGPRGWIQVVNFLLLAASLFSFALVLRRQFRSGVSSIAGPAVFVLMTIGILMAAAFTMDAPGVLPTLVGRLHAAGGFLFFPWMSVALLLVARRFRRDSHWRSYLTFTLATGLFCLVALVFFLVFVGLPDAPPRLASDYRGLVQRMILVPFLSWMALVTRRAYRGSTESSASLHARHAARLPS